mgnify:CR=1 FL=1
MKIVRYRDYISGKINYGAIINDKIFNLKNSHFDKNLQVDKKKNIELNIDNLLPPCNQSKIVAVAINYSNPNKKKQFFNEPLIFIKSSNAIYK